MYFIGQVKPCILYTGTYCIKVYFSIDDLLLLKISSVIYEGPKISKILSLSYLVPAIILAGLRPWQAQGLATPLTMAAFQSFVHHSVLT